jgi:hypothetical protein
MVAWIVRGGDSMKQPESFTCDICGEQKTPGSEWWILCITWVDLALVVAPWNDDVAGTDRAKHTCGYSCTQKLVERFLHYKTLDAPKIAVSAGVAL